jgi:hypothetical protein
MIEVTLGLIARHLDRHGRPARRIGALEAEGHRRAMMPVI